MGDFSGQNDLNSGSEDAMPPGLPLVPLFPLPNVVLFPQAVLPLHIFEDRYKIMTRHALEGDRLIAMALLLAGWEKCYYAAPPIEPVVCVGSILTSEKLPDGRYNFLLQGKLRARVLGEVGGGPYRLARVEALVEIPATAADLELHRTCLVELFKSRALANSALVRQFGALLTTPMPTADVADLAAFTFLEDPALKQLLLAETDVGRRISHTIESLEHALHVGPGFGFPSECPPPPTPAPADPALADSATARRFRNPSLN